MSIGHVKAAARMFFRRVPVSGLRSPISVLLASCFLLLASLSFISCNSPFQPKVEFSPRLNVYSILFANSKRVYVRVTSVTNSQSGDVAQPVHGADVSLVGPGEGDAAHLTRFVDTTAVIDGDTASFYFGDTRISPGGTYTVTVSKDGYPTATASATVPVQFQSVPDQNFYSTLQTPGNIQQTAELTVPVSRLASAAFARIVLEYRGLDANGNLRVGSFDVTSIDTLDPFIELTSASMAITMDVGRYKAVLSEARSEADSLTAFHLYADIIVTQADNNFYRFYITSLRTINPLVMRTDKIIFSNIFNDAGTGIVAGVSVDTTRVFLY